MKTSKKTTVCRSVTFAAVSAALCVCVSCLQADYNTKLEDYYPAPPEDVVRTFSTSSANVLVITITGARFQEEKELDPTYFELSQGGISVPVSNLVRDSGGKVVLFTSSLAGDCRLVIRAKAFDQQVFNVVVQPYESGVPKNGEGANFGNSKILNIAYGGGKFVAVGEGGKLAYSSDGEQWHAVPPGVYSSGFDASTDISAVEWGGEFFYTAGIRARMGYSANGISWNGWGEDSFNTTDIYCMTYGGGRFLIAGANGKVVFMRGDQRDFFTIVDNKNLFSDTDGNRLADFAIKAAVYGKIGGEDTFVAGGYKGWLVQCRNTNNRQMYTETTEFNGLSINGLAFGNGVFVAVGNAGKITSSTDTYVWTPRQHDTSYNFQKVIFTGGEFIVTGGKFIAAGTGGHMKVSDDGASWTERSPGSAGNPFTSGEDITAICSGGGRVVAAAVPSGGGTARIVSWFEMP